MQRILALAPMRLTTIALAGLWCLSFAACLAEQGKCSAHQELNAADLCVCERGYVPDEHLLCKRCGENEISRGDSCECKDGYERDAKEGCVEQTSTSLGASCSGDTDCQADSPHCEASAAEPYCTRLDCTEADGCSGGYACDLHSDPPMCLRPPSGLGDSCTTQEDCAGKEASYCETNRAKNCLVPNCQTDEDCFIGWECCDLTTFGLPALCVREAACPLP
jgi:hypothetical protein